MSIIISKVSFGNYQSDLNRVCYLTIIIQYCHHQKITCGWGCQRQANDIQVEIFNNNYNDNSLYFLIIFLNL